MNRNAPAWRVVSKLGPAAIVYFFLLGVGAAFARPFWPRARLGWCLFLLFAPLFIVIAEAVGEMLSREPIERWVETRTLERRFSGTRIVYHLIKSLLLLGLIGGVIWAVHHQLPGIASFLHENFGPMSDL